MMQLIGKEIEEFVGSYLQKQGLKLLEKNFRSRFGEIDLIMKDKEDLVFVEVRFRKNSFHGDGVSTVNRYKQKRIKRAAVYYLQKNNLYDEVACRFDVVGVSGDAIKEICWIKDAFWDRW